jgi:hypothetical protein
MKDLPEELLKVPVTVLQGGGYSVDEFSDPNTVL